MGEGELNGQSVLIEAPELFSELEYFLNDTTGEVLEGEVADLLVRCLKPSTDNEEDVEGELCIFLEAGHESVFLDADESGVALGRG